MPPASSSTMISAAIAIPRFLRRAAMISFMAVNAASSECLQELQERRLGRFGKLSAVGPSRVPDVAVARHRGVEPEEPSSSLLGEIGPEAAVRRVVHIVAAIENLGSLLGRLQERTQRRYRTVVQIRCAQPDAIERHVGVAEGLAEMTEAVWRLRIQRALVDGELVDIAVETVAIGTDLLDRRDETDPLAAEVAPALPMAARAIPRIDRRPLRCEILVDRICIGRRRKLQ